MSQAEDLLNSLADGQAYIIDPSTEEHIVIGQDRKITVPQSLKRLAVQYDHNVETVTFDCPRYWDGVDMSKMYIYINYTRADKEVGMFKAENVAVDESDESTMHFTWTISRNVTEIKGNIVFIVCIKAVDEDGNETIHWNSELCNGCYISEGLECSEIIEEKYADIISQLLGITGISIDNELSLDSNDPVANKVITARINEVEASIGANNDAILATASSYADGKTSESLAEAKVYTNVIASDVLTDAKEYTDAQKALTDVDIDAKAEATLTDAKTYSDEVVAAEVTAREAGDADTLTEAKAYSDNKVLVNKNEWVAADIVVLEDAKEYTDDLVNAEVTARTAGDSDTLNNAKKYTNEKISAEVTARESGDDITLASAKTYTDEKIADELVAVNAGDTNTLASAKTYTDEKISAEVKSRNSADTDILASAKAYTDEREDVIEGIISTKDAATLASAKAYADEVVASEIGARTTGDTNTLASAKDYTDEQIAGLINGAPSTLDTLGEVATAMSENADVVQALDAAVGSKASDADLKAHVNDIENPHNVTKSQLGLGSVENKSSEDIRGELTKDNVVSALGYTPPKTDTTYSEATTEAAGLMSAEDKVKVGYLDNVNSDVQGQIDDLAGGLHHTNTTMQGQIDDLGEEITNLNTDITDLGTAVEKDVEGLQSQIDSKTLAVGVASGEYITVDDSTDGEVIELDISGKSTQVQYTGKNLLNYEVWKQVPIINGTAVFENNGVTITASSSDSYTSYNNDTIFSETAYPVNEGDIITLSWESDVYGGSDIEGWAYIFGNAATSSMNCVDARLTNHVKYTVPSGVTYISFRFGVKGDGNTISYKNIQLELGSEATDYEPYVGGIPSPNPDYPQEITSVADGGSVKVISCGKNLWDMRELIGVTDNTSKTIYSPIRLKPNVKYYIKRCYTDGTLITGSQQDTLLLNKINDNKTTIKKITNDEYFILTEDEAKQINYVLYYTNASGGKVHGEFYISETDEYEPYKESKSTLPINPLRSLPNGTKDELIFNRDGSGKIVRRVGEVTFDGSDDEIWRKNDTVSYNYNYIYCISKSSLGISTGTSRECYCTHLMPTNQSGINTENIICIYHSAYTDYIYVNIPLLFNNDSTINTTSKLKGLLAENPVTVQYELATPFEEPLTAEQINALLSLKTYENVTNVYSNDTLQPELEMTYFKNTNIGKALAAGYKSNLATEIHDGLMSAEDKQKMSEIDLNTLATAEASGEYITVEDAAGAPFSSFGMTGKSTQVQYSGKNLLDAKLEATSSYGVTCTDNGDGTFTLNGTATDNDASFFIFYNLEEEGMITSDSALKIVGCPSGGSGSSYYIICHLNGTTWMTSGDSGDGVQIDSGDSISAIQICVKNGTKVSNLLFKPMLTTDLDATYDDFEPYVGGIPSPNPDYPQEITSVADGGSIEVVSCGKNLWDGTVIKRVIVNGKLTVIDNNFYSIVIPAKAGNVYTISRGSVLANYFRYAFLKEEPAYNIDVHNYSVNDGNLSMMTIPTPNDCKYLMVVLSNSNGTEKVENTWYQIEVGTVATSYEPYQGSEATLSIDPLRSLPNGVKDELIFNADGSGKIVRRVGKQIASGSVITMAGKGDTGNPSLVVNRENIPLTLKEVLCNKGIASNEYKYGTFYINPANFVFVGTPNDTLETLKQKYDGAVLLYKLETPTEEELTAEQLSEILNLRTYESVSNINTNDSLQPNLNIEYYKNTNVGKACGDLCAKLNTLLRG